MPSRPSRAIVRRLAESTMSIKCNCPKCGENISVPESAASTQGKCSGCGTDYYFHRDLLGRSAISENKTPGFIDGLLPGLLTAWTVIWALFWLLSHPEMVDNPNLQLHTIATWCVLLPAAAVAILWILVLWSTRRDLSPQALARRELIDTHLGCLLFGYSDIVLTVFIHCFLSPRWWTVVGAILLARVLWMLHLDRGPVSLR